VRPRPIGVTLLAILFLAAAALWTLGGLAFALAVVKIPPALNVPAEQAGIVGGVLIVFGLCALAIGLGLWWLRNWARLAAVVLSALGVGVAIIGLGYAIMYAFSAWEVGRQALSIFIRSVILWYLIQPHVKQAFGAEPAPAPGLP
jgi:hypothetical protein